MISKYYKAKMIKGFPCGSAGTESTCIAGNLGSILSLGRRRERKGNRRIMEGTDQGWIIGEENKLKRGAIYTLWRAC